MGDTIRGNFWKQDCNDCMTESSVFKHWGILVPARGRPAYLCLDCFESREKDFKEGRPIKSLGVKIPKDVPKCIWCKRVFEHGRVLQKGNGSFLAVCLTCAGIEKSKFEKRFKDTLSLEQKKLFEMYLDISNYRTSYIILD